MSYRDEYRTFQRESFWTLPRIAVLALTFGVVSSFGVWFASWLTAPTRILTPEKAVANYEWFHDAHNEFLARVRQLAAHRKIAEETTDPSERIKLRIEIGGIQTSCRSLASAYNSRATQSHRSLFAGRTAPERLSPEACE